MSEPSNGAAIWDSEPLRIVVGKAGGLLEGMESPPIVRFFPSFGRKFKQV
jgi:hypothetical protein